MTKLTYRVNGVEVDTYLEAQALTKNKNEIEPIYTPINEKHPITEKDILRRERKMKYYGLI